MRVINVNEFVNRLEEESITYRTNKCSHEEYFNISLPMKSNFIGKLDIELIFREKYIEYKAIVPISVKQGKEDIGMRLVNEMNSHHEITSYYLEDKSVIKARYLLKVSMVMSNDYILSAAYDFARAIDESLCRIFCK